MGLAIKGLLAVFWLFVVPTAAGIPFLKKKSDYTLSESFLIGYLFLFALAEIMILPMIYLKLPLHILVWSYGIVITLTALAGIVLFRKRIRSYVSQLLTAVQKASPFFWCAVVLILMQMAIVALYAHFDADDAFYVATATTAVETDTIFSINAYTGLRWRNLPTRYILSPFPVFLAIISELCAGLHPSITAHTIFPPVFQVVSYAVVYQLGCRWFPNNIATQDHTDIQNITSAQSQTDTSFHANTPDTDSQNKLRICDNTSARGIFLFLVAVLNCFTTYSVYNAGNFQMIRIWQGKALLAAALLPMLLYLSLSIIMEEKPKYSWALLIMGNTACCLLSSMGIILAPLLQGCFLLLGLLRFRSLKRTVAGFLCCIPSAILGIIYIFVL